MKPKWATLIAGLSLLTGWVVVFFRTPAASNESFFPAWFWLLFLLVGLFSRFGDAASGIFTMMIPALFFFAWNPRLFLGSVKVPRRSYALFAVGTVYSLDYFYSAWNEGLRVQGVQYTYTFFALNIALVAALSFMFARRWRAAPSFRSNLFLHWTLCAWLFWFSLPLLGQLSLP